MDSINRFSTSDMRSVVCSTKKIPFGRPFVFCSRTSKRGKNKEEGHSETDVLTTFSSPLCIIIDVQSQTPTAK